MVYSNQMVVSVSTSAGITREIRQAGTDSVYIPFGSDYSLRFKNMSSRRAVVSVEVDGDDALDGTRLVLGANESGSLEGFMKGSTVRQMFRFIEKTGQISEHRGDRMEDGLIRVSWQFEAPPRPLPKPEIYLRDRSSRRGSSSRRGKGIVSDSFGGEGNFEKVAPMTYGADINITSVNDEVKTSGITVPGADTSQHFNTTHVGRLDPEVHVIVIELRGHKSQGQVVTAPLLARKKYACPTCGNLNSSADKFCPGCGTNLT